MRRSQFAWALMLAAVGSAGALADKLDKSTCNVLNAELAGLVAIGTRDDMERGPAWAKTNLPQEKLQKIMRLIELEEQLEFRCGLSRSRVAATAPAKADKVVVPDEPERKPERKSSSTKSIPDQAVGAKPMPDAVKTVAREPAAASPSPRKAMVDSGQPLKTPPVGAQPAVTAARPAASQAPAASAGGAKPLADVVKTVARPPVAASPSAPPATVDGGEPLKTPSGAPLPAASAAKPAATQAPAAAVSAAPMAPAKSSRRQSSAGYVSPSEVNPYFVTRYGDTQ